MALLEMAAGQGHAYAMHYLASEYEERKEHERAMEWHVKGAETGLPIAMHSLACYIDSGEGLAAPDLPDYPAAAGWYKRAAGHHARPLFGLITCAVFVTGTTPRKPQRVLSMTLS